MRGDAGGDQPPIRSPRLPPAGRRFVSEEGGFRSRAQASSGQNTATCWFLHGPQPALPSTSPIPQGPIGWGPSRFPEPAKPGATPTPGRRSRLPPARFPSEREAEIACVASGCRAACPSAAGARALRGKHRPRRTRAPGSRHLLPPPLHHLRDASVLGAPAEAVRNGRRAGLHPPKRVVPEQMMNSILHRWRPSYFAREAISRIFLFETQHKWSGEGTGFVLSRKYSGRAAGLVFLFTGVAVREINVCCCSVIRKI